MRRMLYAMSIDVMSWSFDFVCLMKVAKQNSQSSLGPCCGCAHAWQWCNLRRALGSDISLHYCIPGAFCSILAHALRSPPMVLGPAGRTPSILGGVRVIHALQLKYSDFTHSLVFSTCCLKDEGHNKDAFQYSQMESGSRVLHGARMVGARFNLYMDPPTEF